MRVGPSGRAKAETSSRSITGVAGGAAAVSRLRHVFAALRTPQGARGEHERLEDGHAPETETGRLGLGLRGPVQRGRQRRGRRAGLGQRRGHGTGRVPDAAARAASQRARSSAMRSGISSSAPRSARSWSSAHTCCDAPRLSVPNRTWAPMPVARAMKMQEMRMTRSNGVT